VPLRHSGTHDATYPVALDAPGLDLRALAGLPEGAYAATLEGAEVNVCRFAVAEYRLAPLWADLDGSLLEGSPLATANVDRAIRMWE